MKLDERLTEHFAQSPPDLTCRPSRLDAVISAGQSRSPLGKLMAGILGVAAVATLALAAAATGLLGQAGSMKDDEPSRVVVSPFLTTENRMRAADDQVLFTVTTDSPSYWRLASLDVYADHIWKLKGDFNAGLPELETGTPNDDETVTIHQEFQILALGEIWLPTAPEPAAAAASEFEITADPVSRNLVVPNDLRNGDGLRYSIVSRVATPSPDQLRAAPQANAASIRGEYLSTFGFPPATGELAAELTVGMSTDYDRLIAIQDHLSSFEHAFLPPGSNADPTERFLEAGRGSSLDFASTFAMMARELGIPSRVALGFTPGRALEPDAAGLMTFEVTNRHAHAWPEVYFEGIGWLAFEPTPGLGS